MHPSFWRAIHAGTFVIAVYAVIMVPIHLYQDSHPTPPTDEITSVLPLSTKACETALVFMGLTRDTPKTPPRLNSNDFSNVLFFRAECEASADRFALVKTRLTDERLVEMIETLAMAMEQLQNTTGSSSPQTEPDQESESDCSATSCPTPRNDRYINPSPIFPW